MTDYAGVKAWRKANPDKRAAQDKRYAKKHPETMKRASKAYRAKNADRIREMGKLAARARRKKDPEGQRRRMQAYLDRQRIAREELAGRPPPKVCEVCGELHIRIVFDHCHKLGHFRGWICDRCNRVLGLAYDSPRVLRLLAQYLEDDQNGKA
jgi:hypothetical protein